ncbi:hypothetical protein DFP91_3337 [Pseudorhodoplanes sinuspersici]|nr:hypothetical protein DFP91_3337 [Pseudorhodoplanes sinuspersici]
MLAADYAFWLAVAFIVACNFYYGPRIKSDRVAMQWGLDGKPTWHAPKQIALWGTVAFALIVRLLIWTAMTYAPSWTNSPEIGLLLFSVVLAAVHLWVLRGAAQAK